MKKNFYRMVAFLTAALMVLSNNEIMAFASENAPEETTVIEETVIDEPEETTEDIIVEETSEETSEEVIAEDETSEENINEEIAEELTEEEVDETATEEVSEEDASEITEEVVEESTEEVTEESTEEVTEEISEEATEENTEEIFEEEISEIEDAVVEEDFEGATADIASGTSNDISWRITSAGKLIITGSGDWKRYKFAAPYDSEVYAPWKAYDSKIKSAQVTLTGTTDASHMFDHCLNMTKVDLKGFDTSNVINMSDMFNECWDVTQLDVSNFNTSKVTDFSGMFEGCHSITSMDLSNFDTSNAEDMSDMFFGCFGLKNLNVNSFITSKVTDMSRMFSTCSDLVSLDLSSFDTSNVTTFEKMFYNCYRLILPDMSSFKTSKVTDMSFMFTNCESLIYLDLSNFDTSSVESISGMFSGCKELSSLDISNFDTKSLEKSADAYGTFDRCNKISKIYTPKNFTLADYHLPGSVEWKDSDGNIYDYFPQTSKLLVTTTYGEDEYFIMYELDGGKNNKDNKMKYPAGKSFTLKNPTKTGYTFAGWVDIKTAEKVTVAKGKNYVVRATWNPNKYTVTFYGNGGTATVGGETVKSATQEMVYDTTARLNPQVSFEKKGYHRVGWTANSNGKGKVYSDNDYYKNLTAKSNGNVKLYAKWEADKYYIAFNSNVTSYGIDSGDCSYLANPYLTVEYGKKVKLPEVYDTLGHNLLGWSTEATGKVVYKNKATVKNLAVNYQTITLYAVWSEALTYNVKFNANGGTGKLPAAQKGLSYNTKKFVAPSCELKAPGSEYRFDGWSTSKIGFANIYVPTLECNLDTSKKNQTITLYAVWVYDVQVYNPNLGEIKLAQNCPYGYKFKTSVLTTFTDISMTGYSLIGFNTSKSAAEKGKVKYKLSSSVKNVVGKVFYPVYKPNTYTIKLNANGGSGKMSSQTLTYDKDATLKACAFKNGTKKFVGWSTDKNAATATYTDKQSVKNLTKKNKDTITLYAVWQ